MPWIHITITALILSQVVLVESQTIVNSVSPSAPNASVSVNAKQGNSSSAVEVVNSTLAEVHASESKTVKVGDSIAVNAQRSTVVAGATPQAGNTGTAHAAPNPSHSLVVEVPSSLFKTTAHAVNTVNQTAVQKGEYTVNTIKLSAQASSSASVEKTVSASETVTAKPRVQCEKMDWQKPVLESCRDKKCVEEQLTSLSKQRECKQQKPENVTIPEMREVVEKLGISLAESIKAALSTPGQSKNTSSIVVLGNVALSAGVIDSENYNRSKKKFVTIPDNLTAFPGEWSKMIEAVSIPITELPTSGKSVYVWASLDDFAEDRSLKTTEMDWDDNIILESDISDMYVVRDKLLSRKKVPPKKINSRTILFSLKKEDSTFLKGPFREPAKITFQHKNGGSDFFDPACTWWDKTIWSRDGMAAGMKNGTHTECKLKHFSVFSVVMKVEEKVDYSDRELVVTLASVFGSISLLCLLLCCIIIIGVGYHHPDQMRIALNLDVALILGHLVFFIGLSTKQNMFFATVDTCKVIAPFEQLFELAALSWLLMEGLHYYNTLRPFFDETNTVPIAFYFAVGWGIPVAVASACADFAYPHFGTPEPSEFCWLFIRGAGAWYFGAPVLLLVLLNFIVRACILKEVITWKGEPDDLIIERATARLKSFLPVILSITLAWLFGVLAVNNTDNKAFHYTFLVFFVLQGLSVFIFYSVNNQELRQYYKEKKEEEIKRETATVSFEYVP